MESKVVNWWIYDMAILLVISKALPVPTSLVVKKFFLWPLTWFDLIWQFFACRACGAHFVHGRKNLLYNHWPGMFPVNCWSNFFFWNLTPHWAGTADFWPRVKITADATVGKLFSFLTMSMHIKFKYSEKATKFEKIPHHTWHQFGRFFSNNVWSSQNIWTLCIMEQDNLSRFWNNIFFQILWPSHNI